MRQFDPSWAGGFFSGEGSSYITKMRPTPHYKGRDGGGRRREYWYVALTLSQKNLETLEAFRDAIGGVGRITYNARKDSPIWMWSCQGRNAEEVMRVLFPHLSKEKRWQYLRSRRGVRVFMRGGASQLKLAA